MQYAKLYAYDIILKLFFIYLRWFLQLREYAKAIRELVVKGGSDGDIRSLIQEQMSTVYRIVGICLGIPSDTFTWTYYDKSKAFQSVGPITPMEFYEKHVKLLFNVDDKVNDIISRTIVSMKRFPSALTYVCLWMENGMYIRVYAYECTCVWVCICMCVKFSIILIKCWNLKVWG